MPPDATKESTRRGKPAPGSYAFHSPGVGACPKMPEKVERIP